MKTLPWLLGALLTLSVLTSNTALAEDDPDADHFDWLYARPFIGYEISQFGSANINTGTAGGSVTTHGLAFGAEAGLRLGPFGFAAMYQRTEVLDDLSKGANLNKLYGLFNVNIRTGSLNGVLTLGGGWTNLTAGTSAIDGIGGRVGAGLDYYIFQWLSAGGGVSFDFQGYSGAGGWLGAYGGTFAGRVGFYL